MKLKSITGLYTVSDFMSEELKNELISHVIERLGIFSNYLIDALDNGEVFVIASVLGHPTEYESDFKNLEFLRAAGLLKRDERYSRSGRMKIHVYTLCEGKEELVKKLKEERLIE